MDYRYAKAYMRERQANAEARRLAALADQESIGTGIVSRLANSLRPAVARRQLVTDCGCCAV